MADSGPSAIPPLRTIEATPNPHALKCVLEADHWPATRSFRSREAAASDPLAARLFAVPGVIGVMFCRDFVTVNKDPEASWPPIRRKLRGILRDGPAGG